MSKADPSRTSPPLEAAPSDTGIGKTTLLGGFGGSSFFFFSLPFAFFGEAHRPVCEYWRETKAAGWERRYIMQLATAVPGLANAAVCTYGPMALGHGQDHIICLAVLPSSVAIGN